MTLHQQQKCINRLQSISYNICSRFLSSCDKTLNLHFIEYSGQIPSKKIMTTLNALNLHLLVRVSVEIPIYARVK